MTTTKLGGEALRIALEGIVAGETTAPIVEVRFKEGESERQL